MMAHSSEQPWRVENIDYAQIDLPRVQDNADLFCLLASASFIESGADTYSRTLIDFYAGHEVVESWLSGHWEPEELQHGRALKRYVQSVWPEFDWDAAYAGFFAQYSQLCTTDELESDQALEMVARCVVETGTTTYYQALAQLTDEPVLLTLLGHIRADEVRHFKHFLAYFRQLQAQHGVNRWRIASTLRRRVLETRNSDADIALRHVWAHLPERFKNPGDTLQAMTRRVTRQVMGQLPFEQAIKMLLKPMELPPGVQKMVQRPLALLAQRVLTA